MCVQRPIAGGATNAEDQAGEQGLSCARAAAGQGRQGSERPSADMAATLGPAKGFRGHDRPIGHVQPATRELDRTLGLIKL